MPEHSVSAQIIDIQANRRQKCRRPYNHKEPYIDLFICDADHGGDVIQKPHTPVKRHVYPINARIAHLILLKSKETMQSLFVLSWASRAVIQPRLALGFSEFLVNASLAMTMRYAHAKPNAWLDIANRM